ncbi:TPA: hypothetical protein ACHICQ_005022 [Enterobacter roggenkampii]|nr:hypothetical protein [Enterobacter roggenkampii]
MKKVILVAILSAVSVNAMAQDEKWVNFNIRCTTLNHYVVDSRNGNDLLKMFFNGVMYPITGADDGKDSRKFSFIWGNVAGHKITMSADETNPSDLKYIFFDYDPKGVKHRCVETEETD